jgi:hypothetical protein
MAKNKKSGATTFKDWQEEALEEKPKAKYKEKLRQKGEEIPSFLSDLFSKKSKDTDGISKTK